MGIVKDLEESTQTTNQAIYKVIQAQRALALRHRHPNLMEYLERTSWTQTAAALTAHFWPKTVSQELFVQAEIERLYLAGLILAPLSGQCPGFWNPWRHNGHLVCWLRQYTSMKQGKVHLFTHGWNWEEAIEGLAQSAQSFGIMDHDFIEFCSELLVSNVYCPTVRGQFARKIFAPLLFHEQGLKIFRTAKANQSVTWWDEKHAFVLSKRRIISIKGQWTDLTTDSCTLWNYTARIKKKALLIFLSDDFLKSVRNNIADILNSGANPQQKVFSISTVMLRVHRWAKHCPNARPQCNELERWLRQKTEKNLFMKYPRLEGMYFSIGKADWDHGFYPRNKSGLLEDITLDSWLKWWGPRR